MTEKFYDRFDIKIDLEEARKRFINRAANQIFTEFFYEMHESTRNKIERYICTQLGDKYDSRWDLEFRVVNDFHRTLLSIEALYKCVQSFMRDNLDRIVKNILKMAEFDLGISWQDGIFTKSGAKLLDDKLVNEELHWLRAKEYTNVLDPFEKGLEHYLQSEKRPELLSDVITDMYEALEAMAKIVAERPAHDLSANKELFIKKVKASDEYKKILTNYIDYANKFRHAAAEGKEKPRINPKEAESFIYLTGLFLRLAMN
jgi:hypothetical protein